MFAKRTLLIVIALSICLTILIGASYPKLKYGTKKLVCEYYPIRDLLLQLQKFSCPEPGWYDIIRPEKTLSLNTTNKKEEFSDFNLDWILHEEYPAGTNSIVVKLTNLELSSDPIFHLFVGVKFDRLLSPNRQGRNVFSIGNSASLSTNPSTGNLELMVRVGWREYIINSLNHVDQFPHIHEISYNGKYLEYLIDDISQGQVRIEGYQSPFHGQISIGQTIAQENRVFEIIAFNRLLTNEETFSIRMHIEDRFPSVVADKHPQRVLIRENHEQGFKSPVIIDLDENTFGLFYSVRKKGKFVGITYAISNKDKPHIWTKTNKLILAPSSSGWDSHSISDFWMIREDDGWKMLYADRVSGAIGLATGKSLDTLKKYPGNPVLKGTSGMQTFLRYPSFIKFDHKYHLFYDGRKENSRGRYGAIFHAVSDDLISWERSVAPVISPSEDGGGFGATDVLQPAIAVHEDILYLAYSGFNAHLNAYCCPHQIGIARYSKAFGWQRLSGNPILSWSYGDWDTVNASEPFLWSLNGNLILYYMGKREPVGAGGDFGYATLNIEGLEWY